jgi:hypothetical protein
MVCPCGRGTLGDLDDSHTPRRVIPQGGGGRLCLELDNNYVLADLHAPKDVSGHDA